MEISKLTNLLTDRYDEVAWTVVILRDDRIQITGFVKRMNHRTKNEAVVDEVEVPYREMGANRRFGKIENSADASQGCHALIQCPFKLQYVKPWQVTVRQIVLSVAS